MATKTVDMVDPEQLLGANQAMEQTLERLRMEGMLDEDQISRFTAEWAFVRVSGNSLATKMRTLLGLEPKTYMIRLVKIRDAAPEDCVA